MKNSKFEITWFKYERYGSPITRKTVIESPDAKSALATFKSSFGGFKKNAIVSINDLAQGTNINVEDLKKEA
jgi:hypothetical protein